MGATTGHPSRKKLHPQLLHALGQDRLVAVTRTASDRPNRIIRRAQGHDSKIHLLATPLGRAQDTPDKTIPD